MKASPEVQRRLLDLQAIDTALAQLAHRRRTLPELAEIDAAAREISRLKDERVRAKVACRCGGCRIELSGADLARVKAAAPDEVMRCEECGRIVVRVQESAGQPADGITSRARESAGDTVAASEVPGAEVPDAGARPVPSWAPPPLDDATRVILVRHGETTMTQSGRYSGRGDVPLTDEGEAQAIAAAARVAGISRDVAVVLSSPLSRCVRTAEVIAAEVGGVPVTVVDDLIECDFGEWEGRTFAEVQERWPAEMTAWLASVEVAPPGGESFRTVAIRVRRALAAALQAYGGRAVVMVSHVTPIKLALQDALAASDAFLHRLYLDAAGVSTMDIWPDGNVAVRSVNETAHLR